MDCFNCTSCNRSHSHFHVPWNFYSSSKFSVFISLFHSLLFSLCGPPGRQSSQFGRFSFLLSLLTMTLSIRLAESMWSVCISKSQKLLCTGLVLGCTHTSCLYGRIWIIFTPWEFFTSALANGLSLEPERQQVSSNLRVSSQYSGRSQQYCSLDRLQSTSYFQVLHSLHQSRGDCNLHLLFCCVLPILTLIWLVLMGLFCAAITRDSVSLLRFSFLTNVHVFSSEILLVSHLKCPWSYLPTFIFWLFPVYWSSWLQYCFWWLWSTFFCAFL